MTCVAEKRFVLSPFKAPPQHNPPHFFFCCFFAFFSLPFQVRSKGLRKHMQSIAPLKWEQVVGFMSDSLSCLSPFFERNISQGLCTHWISLFWQSKVENNVFNKLLFLSLLPLSAALYFLRGLSFFVLTGTAPCPFDVGLTVKDNGASWDRCHPCQ